MKGFHTDIEKDTVANNNFRKVLFSGPHHQLVLMALKPGEDIGMETHPYLDQFFRIDEGSGEAMIGNETFKISNGSAFIVPQNTKHNVTAGKNGLKLYAVYSKKQHPDKVIDKTKQDAIDRETKMKKSKSHLEEIISLRNQRGK